MLYHGTHTSLYSSLPSEIIPILEDAILKTRVRLYDAAEKIFVGELSAYSHVPIVALEHAELSLHRYKFFRVLEVLKNVPDDAFSDSEEDRQVQQLFAIFRATVRLQTEAIYEPAMQAIRNLQKAWASKSVCDYSDIEVESVRKYGLACIYLSSASSFIEKKFKLFPVPNPSTTPPLEWQGLTDLRVSLFSQSRFMEAIRFSTIERSKYTAIERYQVTLSLLNSAMDHRAQVADTNDELPWSAAILQLKQDLGTLLADLGAKTEAEVFFSSLEKDLEDVITKINGKDGSLKVSDSLETMNIEYYRLKAIEKGEPTQARFQQALKLGERMTAVGHFSASSCNDLAVTWAKRLYSGDELNTICTDIQFCSQHLLENIQGRIQSALTNLMDIVRPRATNINEATKNIEIIENFIRRHPSVGLPTALPGIRQQLAILDVLYDHIGGRLPLIADTESEEARELQSALPTSYNTRRVESSSKLDDETLKLKHILDRQSANDDEFNMMYGFFVEPTEVRARKRLRNLLIEESASGVLTEDAMVQMFGVKHENRSDVREHLLKLSERDLLERLAGNLDNPIREAEWAKRKPYLKAWLLDSTRPRLPVRQCLWIDFHNIRSQVWALRCIEGKISREFVGKQEIGTETIESKRARWARELSEETIENIQAIEDRIELEEAKSGYGNNHYEKETFIAASSIPQLWVQVFFCSHIPNKEPDEICISSLKHAEEVARRQLAHWRSVKNYQMIAQSAMMIATIAQYRIECRMIKEATTIDQSLEEALKLLEEAESLFGTTLYEVDLSHSLAALESKFHVGSKMRIWTVGKTAARLLFHAIQMIDASTEGSEDQGLQASHQDKVLKLWQWVQRVKARTLAQSMDLENVVPDVMLVGIQDSINEERATAKSVLATSMRQKSRHNEAQLEQDLEYIRREELSAPPLNLLPGVRRVMKEGKVIITGGTTTANEIYPPEMSSKIILDGILSMMRDLNFEKVTAEQMKRKDDSENGTKKKLWEELSEVSARIATRPALAKLVTIADLLNREEALIHETNNGPANDRFQRRLELQRLRKEMGQEPALRRMLRIREGWPLSSNDLQKIAAERNGKVVFVDWLRVTSSFNQNDRIYMIVWRNGVCKLIDLKTDFKKPWQEILAFFDLKNKDVYLPEVDRTPLEEMDWERFIPKNVDIEEDDVRNVENCIELVRPLFDDPLIEAEDLLVLSATEGFHNFPLHAIEDQEKGPLVLNHPVIYIPSLSVLHKCFWARRTSSETPIPISKKLRSLVLGGVDSREEAYQYGGKAVNRIGSILKSPDTTFIGPDATLENFNGHISGSALLHIHLHTNHSTAEEDNPATPHQAGLTGPPAPGDTTFTVSPLNQAIVFNGPSPSSQLSARQILALKLARGAHVNLVCCASGKQGKFDVPSAFTALGHVTDEVMGLVPAFLFAGAGSVTSALWPIQDEHGAVFSCLLFGELMRAREAEHGERGEGKGKARGKVGWFDLAEVHRKAVLEMRRIYKQPSAWAGFVLSGYWKFNIR